MAKQGKRLRTAEANIDRVKAYPLEEAVALIKQGAKAKFDETVELALNLGVDPRHADQMVRGTVDLPHGTGRSVRVAVFAKGDKAEEATAAGADVVGAEDLAQSIQGGEINFDRCIATPDMMPVVGRLGRILGPRGLMPNPKLGTVTANVAQAVQAAKAGQVQFRVARRHRARWHRQGELFRGPFAGQCAGVRRRGQPGKAEWRQRHLSQAGGAQLDHGSRGPCRHRLVVRVRARGSTDGRDAKRLAFVILPTMLRSLVNARSMPISSCWNSYPAEPTARVVSRVPIVALFGVLRDQSWGAAGPLLRPRSARGTVAAGGGA